MTRCRTAGVLILKGGEIALERYGMESGPGRRREGYSTTKSIVATLVGAALHDGAIGSLDDCCDLYLPRLRSSAYEGVTVRNVMRMCSGVAWDEEGRSCPARAPNGPSVIGLQRADYPCRLFETPVPPVVARLRHANRLRECPFCGVDRK
ncbi:MULTISPECIES: serine hydrolase [unclassified Bradyrhizobium]|uniref:serine hydrolase n=1 Tax=unclassified Bradyrhizobium TaxID=2631580 RepID=UPI00042417B4|nr:MULTISPECIES: serine hydrolase domain-containing protein [unclassified Bradyrhizobium]QIG94811.1 beta-lactamase family protein [Bradyrhizobium sp. 6(2017)]